MLLFFTFGAFAVGLAQDLPSHSPVHATELHRLLKTDPVQLDAYKYTVVLQSDTWNVPNTQQPDFEEYRASVVRGVEPSRASPLPRVQVPKVSFQILQSVLLI
jgi:hypothetical protein